MAAANRQRRAERSGSRAERVEWSAFTGSGAMVRSPGQPGRQAGWKLVGGDGRGEVALLERVGELDVVVVAAVHEDAVLEDHLAVLPRED
jgi:hypothetical protein